MKSFTNKLFMLFRALVVSVFVIGLLVFLADDIHNRTSRDVDPRIIRLSANQSSSVISSFTGDNVSMTKHGDTTDIYDGYECADNDNCEVIMPQAAAMPKKKLVARVIQDR